MVLQVNRATFPQVQWLDADRLVRLGRTALVLNCAKEEFVGESSASDYKSLAQLCEQAGEEPEPAVKPNVSVQVCVGLPKEASSMRIALNYARQLSDQGYTIGTGGNTIVITAAVDDTGPPLNEGITIRNMTERKMPRVHYSIVTLDKAGRVIARRKSFGLFLARRSRYYKGNRKTDILIIDNWEFPKNPREAIIEEILERGVGIMQPRFEQGEETAFEINWRPIPPQL